MTDTRHRGTRTPLAPSVTPHQAAYAPIIDGHNDLPWKVRTLSGQRLPAVDVSARRTDTHTDLVRLGEGGVGAQFWSVYVPSTMRPDQAVVATLEQVDLVRRMVLSNTSATTLALTADDIEAAITSGRLASLMGAEGGHSMGESLGVLRMLYALGVRYMTLTHNDNTSWADSATDVAHAGGLSEFGREVVREMNRLGMLVDLSHVADTTMNAALEVSAAPVIFSHSSCRALTNHVRNVPDEVLRRVADNRGLVMLTFVAPFVSEQCRSWRNALTEEIAEQGIDPDDSAACEAATDVFTRRHPKPQASIAQVADHVEHARHVAGLGCIGLGGDFDGCDSLPAGLTDVSRYPLLIEELRARRWSDEECDQLTFRNALRVLREAEAVAARLQTERVPSLADQGELDQGRKRAGGQYPVTPGSGRARVVARTVR